MELSLTSTQKNDFIETLANYIWNRLQNTVSLSSKEISSLYLNWSDAYITNALRQANISIDNSKQLNNFAFIGRKKTTYQLGDSVGDCNDYLPKSAPIEVGIFKPSLGGARN